MSAKQQRPGTTNEFRIRDRREPGHFWLDNEVLDVYGKEIGAYGLATYNVLSRYVYNTGKCCVSMRKIAELLSVSVGTVSKAITLLTSAALISVEEGSDGEPNTYTLAAIKPMRGCSPNEQVQPPCSPNEQTCSPNEQGVHIVNANKEKELSKKDKNKTNPPAPANASAGNESTDAFSKSSEEEKAALRGIWIYYIRTLHRNPRKYTATKKRKLKGLARLRECRKKCAGDLVAAVALMKQAVDALAASEYHVTNAYIDWEQNLFPNAEKIEWWLDRVVTSKDSNGQTSNTRLISRGQQQTLDNLSEAQRGIQYEIEAAQARGDYGGTGEAGGGDE